MCPILVPEVTVLVNHSIEASPKRHKYALGCSCIVGATGRSPQIL